MLRALDVLSHLILSTILFLHLFTNYYVPSTLIGVRDTAVKKQDKNLCSHRTYLLVVETDS